MEDKEQKIKIQFETNADAVGGKVDGLTGKLDATAKTTDNVATSQKKASKSSKDLGGGIESLGGPIGGAISGFKALIKQMWLLVANPVGAVLVAIVGALALVFKAFTSTNAGADKLNQVMAGLSAVIDVLRDRFLKLISLDFVGAFGGVGDEISKEFKEAANLAKALQEVADASRDLGVSRAKLNRDLATSKELITDETASYADKKEAIEKVRIAEGKQTEQELANAKKKLKAIVEQNALSDTSDEDLQKQADAETAVFNLQKEQSENKRALNRLDKKADSEEKSRLKEITDAKTAAFKERLTKQKEAHKLEAEEQKRQNDLLKALQKEKVDAEQNLIKFLQDLNDKTEEEKLARQKERANQEIEILKQKGIDTAAITILNAEKFATLEQELAQKRVDENKVIFDKESEDKVAAAKDLADKEVEIERAKLQQKREIQEQGLNLAGQAVAFLSQVFGKSKKVQKAAMIAEGAVAIGKQVAATNTSIVGALATPQAIATGGVSAIPVIALNAAQGAIGVASTIASTKKALQSLGGGSVEGGGGTSGGARGAGAAGATPQVAFQASSENQIGNTVANNLNAQPPIEAYVVSKSVTDAQQLDNNKINSNSI